MSAFIKFINSVIELLYIPLLFIICWISKFFNKKYQIGLGPEPLINNIYHKKALEKYGYSAETFVNDFFYITKDFDQIISIKNRYLKRILLQILHIDFLFLIFRYEAIYIYFNGGPLQSSKIFSFLEPYLLKTAQIKVVVMPYGGDVQDLSRCNNLLYKDAVTLDYPEHKLSRKRISVNIDRWTAHSDHIISGCDWVDYMHHWDTLMSAHFSIDIDSIRDKYFKEREGNKTFKILHAPNHRSIKGTNYLIDAVKRLNDEGYDIELRLLERKSNDEVLKEINNADLIVDQLIIGWYAMFAIESMALEKPVICYLREDLLDFYSQKDILSRENLPLINAKPQNIYHVIKKAYESPDMLQKASKKGPDFVNDMHSIKSVGMVFSNINKSIGLYPKSS